MIDHNPPNQVCVFLSYASEDEEWQKKLETHLRLLQRQGIISIWHNRRIVAGTNKAEIIDQWLEQASLILLLVSADFLASDYCYEVEMKRALERQKLGEAQVIPILLRTLADWRDAPFGHLSPLPTNAKAITSWHDEDEALADVAAGIRRAIEDFLLLPTSPSQAMLSADTHPAADLPEQAHKEASPSSPPILLRIPPSIWKFLIGIAIIVVVSAVISNLFIQQNTKLNPGSSSSQKIDTNKNVTVTATSIPTPSISMVAPAAPKAQQTLNQFCRDLGKGNYSDAYGLLNAYLHTVYSTVNQFKRPWMDLTSKDCIAADFQKVKSDMYTGVITLPRFDNPNPTHWLVTIDDKDVTGIWKVSDWATAT